MCSQNMALTKISIAKCEQNHARIRRPHLGGIAYDTMLSDLRDFV